MNADTEKRCELLVQNRQTIGESFRMIGSLTAVCCAAVYARHNLTAEGESMRQARDVIRRRNGAFSYFRGTGEPVFAVMMDISGDAEGLMAAAGQVYDLLKQVFPRSEYLPVAAMAIARHTLPGQWEHLVVRTREIYDRMRLEHPFLTHSEDSGLCALLALADMDNDRLIERMETCYRLLRGRFSAGDPLQTLSHVLTLMPGAPEQLCDKAITLYDLFRSRGHRWGTYYELAGLGLLAGDARDVKSLSEDVCEADDWLKKQKGFGFWSGISAQQRLMYAGLMASGGPDASDAVALTGTLQTMIAQEVAMMAAIAGATAAANASH